jgi:crossover junction endodeoxyribonuclease RuvC
VLLRRELECQGKLIFGIITIIFLRRLLTQIWSKRLRWNALFVDLRLKMSIYFIGIDPGFSGAICILDENGNIELLEDMPVLRIGSKQELDERRLCGWIEEYSADPAGYSIHCFIEKAQPMPGQGISSTGRYLCSYGIIRGICVGLWVPYTLVSPITWKRSMLKDMKKGKQASIFRVLQLYPELDLERKKDHGKADAILIARYGMQLIGKLKK